jgi:UDPglucose 6-dehydrogenase
MKENKIKIGIIGIGMVGDPIRRWFEEMKGYTRGKELFCFDVNIKKGYSDDVNKADIIFVSVPTPTPADGSSDTSIVRKVVKTIKDGKTVVIKSTVPPGTVEGLQKEFPKKRFIFNPEFLTESQVWSDYIRPDRQILGPTEKGRADVKELQMLLPTAPFSRPWSTDYSKKEINATEAELAKYASNVFGYTKVIYGNILADISTALGIDYEHVRDVISADPRIGPAWLNVTHGNYSGAGGYCFPKDMNALIAHIEKTLLPKLRKNKKKDASLVASLKHAVNVLKAVRTYNRELLKLQGLTEEMVSHHLGELQIKKIRKIR